MQLNQDNNFQHLIDGPINLCCPHCGTMSAMIPVSVPRFDLIHRFKLDRVGIVYRCSSCNSPVFLQFDINSRGNPVVLSEDFEQVSVSLEPFEVKYLAGAVLSDFEEALRCYAASCWNAFAAMSRRCIQSISEEQGASGTTKVQSQLQELKAMGVADGDTFDQLHAIMLSGHDGAHPHLPRLSPARAAVLLQLIKDVLYQLYVRPAKIREAGELRRTAITQDRQG